MNAPTSDAAARSHTTVAVAQREPALSIVVQTSLGELVPVGAAPIPAADYQRATELATTAGREAATLKATVGPEARARGLDAWCERDGAAQAGLKIGLGVVGAALTIVGASIYGLEGAIAGAQAAGAGLASLGVSTWALTAGSRVKRALAKARGQRVESAHVVKLLAPYGRATPEVRAIAAEAVRAEMAGIDSTLSAKAVETRDETLASKPTSPAVERAQRLTAALAALLRRDGSLVLLRYPVDAILACLTEATPAERREMAAAIERCAFDKEQPLFDVGSELVHERRLYRAIRAAENGDAPSA